MSKKRWWEEFGELAEYVYKPKKIRPTLHGIKGFKTSESANLRCERFLTQNSTPFHLRSQLLNADEWVVIFDDSMLAFVEENEEKDLFETSYPVPVKQYTPRIFRYMDKKYVDEFFETGKIRLSSFEAFSQLDNSNLRDEKEGTIKISLRYGNEEAEAAIGLGMDAYVLCATTLNAEEKETKNTFGHNSGFSIEDVDGFINAVNNAFHMMLMKKGEKTHRLQVELVRHGPCMYLLKREHDALILENKGNSMTEFLCGGNEMVVDYMMETVSRYAGEHGMFLKLAEHKDEHEYRILWHIEMDKVLPEIILTAPDARKYCRKISF